MCLLVNAGLGSLYYRMCGVGSQVWEVYIYLMRCVQDWGSLHDLMCCVGMQGWES